jgi:hypothetical protein
MEDVGLIECESCCKNPVKLYGTRPCTVSAGASHNWMCVVNNSKLKDIFWNIYEKLVSVLNCVDFLDVEHM